MSQPPHPDQPWPTPYPPHPLAVGGPGQPAGYPPSAPPPYAVHPAMPTSADEALPPPVAILPVVGTPYGLAMVPVPPITSGPASASLAAGVASIVVSFAVTCFGLVGVNDGWGPTVAGAFALLSLFTGLAGILLGRRGLRQTKVGAGTVRGRGTAIAGVICGAVGIGLTVASFLLSLLLTVEA